MDSFKKLMGGNLIDKWGTVPNGDWDILEDLYLKFINESDTTQRIPKKIHQIWLGEMPDSHKKLISKIKENHPEWEYKLWGDEDLKHYPMINKSLYESIDNYGSKSDIARYEILYNEGGIYLDSDFKMVTNFNDLISNSFFTGVGHSNEPMVFNGLIGCSINNPLMGLVLDGLSKTTHDFSNLNHEEVMTKTGPYYFSNVFFDYIKNVSNEKIVVLPTPYFYPLPATERFKIRNNEEVLNDFIYSFNTNKTICIHLWYNSWQ